MLHDDTDGAAGLDEDLLDEVIARYEGGETIDRIVTFLQERGIPAARDLVERVLDDYKIIRHAESGAMPEWAPQGFSGSVRLSSSGSRRKEGWIERRRRILSQVSHEEVLVRYQEKGETLQTIELAFRARGTDVSAYYLKVILEMHGVQVERRQSKTSFSDLKELARRYSEDGESMESLAEVAGVKEQTLRARLRMYGLIPSGSAKSRPSIENQEKLAARFLAGEKMKDLAKEVGVHQTYLSEQLKKGGHLPDGNLVRLFPKRNGRPGNLTRHRAKSSPTMNEGGE